MSKKIKIELNSPGIVEMLKSAEMEAILDEHVSRISAACGDGYGHDTKQTPSRVIASVYTETPAAVKDNLENNTILRALQ